MAKQRNSLVIGTALDERSAPALAAGMSIARRGNARVTVAHAFAFPAVIFGPAAGARSLEPLLIDSERQAKTDSLRGQLTRYRHHDTSEPRLVVEPGTPHRLLLNTATATGAHLIVLGGPREGTLATLLGSTSDRVVRGAVCPVLIVHNDAALPPKRILAPVDLSPLSEQALLRGLHSVAAWADPAGPPRVELLFVLSEKERYRTRQFTPEQVDRLARDEVERIADRIQAETGITPASSVRVGRPREEIQAALAEQPTDLIVIGTHGHSGFERWVLGRVTANVIHRAPCSVLVVPPVEAEAATQAIDTAIATLS